MTNNDFACKSSFTLTFALEIVGNEIWTDYTEGLLELEQPNQNIKLTYFLYPGYPPYELLINVWHHCARVSLISHNEQVCWVRTWLFLDRRWLTFSISHLIHAQVTELLPFAVTIHPGIPVKTVDHKNIQEHKPTQDIQYQVYIPPVIFGEQRYFAPVLLLQEEEEESVDEYVASILNEIIESFIPLTVYDGIFEQPHSVTGCLLEEVTTLTWLTYLSTLLIFNTTLDDWVSSQHESVKDIKHIRHQDAIMYHVRELTLNKKMPTLYEPPLSESSDSSQTPRGQKSKSRTGKNSKEKHGKSSKEKEVKKSRSNEKERRGKESTIRSSHIYELVLSGNDILAGAGRIIQFNVRNESERPHELGEVLALLSTKDLPAPDDIPVFFVNVESLNQIPVKELEKARINDLRIFWRFGDEEHTSQRHLYTSGNADFCDHRAIPLNPEIASGIVSSFLDNPFEIEIHGFRNQEKKEVPALFGYLPDDLIFNTKVRPTQLKEENNDVIIAVCKIDLHPLAVGTNGLIRGEFPLTAPTVSFAPLKREALCTNDFNATKSVVVPELVIQPHIILESLMSLDVSIGIVGCKPREVNKSYSRLFCIIKEPDHVMALLTEITDANEFLIGAEKKDDLLTGFVLDTGREVFVYVEGPRDGQILQVWELTEDFYPSVRPVFSTYSRYASRIYPDLLAASVPVIALKMHVPLNCLLACPPFYTKPGAPLPARAAVLKIGRIIAGELYYPPTSSEMPTIFEIRSFRLEFCSPNRLISTWPDQNIKLIPSMPAERLSRASITMPQRIVNVFDKTK